MTETSLIKDEPPTYVSEHEADSSFEKEYIRLRQKEGRVYADGEVLHLPFVPAGHIHYTEWQMRTRSYLRLKEYLVKKAKRLTILEAGCGNGWLSHRLSEIPLSEITGTDINRKELLQAKRVFGSIPNLHFTQGSINTEETIHEQYDCIIFASSIQYFPSLKNSIDASFQKLKQGGEIHILDSGIYHAAELREAKARTKNYFLRLGFPAMTRHYFQHCFEELDPYHYKILYKPGFINRYLFRNKNPFPWICIKKT